MAEIVATIGAALETVIQIKQYVMTPIMNGFSYLCCYNSNIQSLRSQVQKLNQKRDNLQLEVDAAKRNAEVIGSDVEEWFQKVVEINAEKNRIDQDTAKVQQGCFYGRCLNVKLRCCVSRDAKKTSEAAAELLQEATKFSKISYPAAPEPISTAPVGIEVESRRSKEDEIIKSLKDDKVYVIAVCGMGGVGKTTMVKKIENKVRDQKIFEEVVMAVVSQPLDLHKVQQEIAEKLGLKLDRQIISARAELLHKRLKAAKSVLVILDDVWEKFNLQEIGIPSKSSHEGRKIKVILTSRDQNVCRNIEDSARIIRLDVLSEPEAWNLFKEKAGDIVDERDFHPIAVDVAKECKGLPLALVTVATALRHCRIQSWKDALHQLKESHLENIPDVEKQVYVPLKWSYDQLPSEEHRYLFLLCCLFPEDYAIPLDTLMRYGFGLRIFSGIANLADARNKVYALVDRLKDRFLLIGGTDDDDSVKMHDLIRDMAISITSKASKEKHVFMVIHDKDLREWPKEDSYDNYTCISLRSDCEITLPEKINCPRLEILCLSFVALGVEIQESTLCGMRGLKVLTTRKVQSLPSSLPFLTNLRSLLLEGSELKILPNEIGELVNLEILSLANSEIVMLQKEIGRLKNLKLLDLSDCSNLEHIVPDMISGLVQLEELLVLESFNNWEAEGAERNNASLAEVASLTKLTTLQIEIPKQDSINFHEDTRNWHKLTRYHVVIGEAGSSYGSERFIKLNLHKSVHLTHSVRALLDNAEFMELSGNGSREISNQLARDGFQRVKILNLRNWGNLESLFHSSSGNQTDAAFLPRAIEFSLEDTDVLKEVCRGHPPAGSFSNLTTIYLRKCNGLKSLFSFSVAAMLSSLKCVYIRNCDVMETVFFDQNGHSGSNATSKITFPKLSQVTLASLPSLSSFCKAIDTNAFEFPRLHGVMLAGSPRFKSFCTVQEDDHNVEQQFFFDQKVMCSGLKSLTFRDMNFKIGIFDPKIPIGNSILFRGISNVEYLSVESCKQLEGVIANDKEEKTNSEVILFPHLKELLLEDLSKLQQFCHMDHVDLPSLESLVITNCPLMETFSGSSQELDPSIATPSFFEEVIFRRIKTLELTSVNAPTKFFSCKIAISNFSELAFVRIYSCARLQSVFSVQMLAGLLNLQELQLRECPVLEEVISEEGQEDETNTKEALFPRLRKLELRKLPKLIRFCHLKDDFKFLLNQKILSSCLKKLTIKRINFKVGIFDPRIPIGHFMVLEYLHVENCSGFVTLFSWNSEMVQEVVATSKVTLFPQLKRLKLKDLTEMQHFCLMNQDILLPSLEFLDIVNCPLIVTFTASVPTLSRSEVLDSNLIVQSFFNKVTCSRTRKLNLRNLNAPTKLFGHRISIDNFSGLRDVSIHNCNRLKSIFSPPMFRGLFNLRKFELSKCPLLEEVISEDEKEDESYVGEILFPQLKELTLSQLPKLIRFCHVKHDLKLPSLKWITIKDCPVLETFSFGSVSLPSLRLVMGSPQHNFISQYFSEEQNDSEREDATEIEEEDDTESEDTTETEDGDDTESEDATEID